MTGGQQGRQASFKLCLSVWRTVSFQHAADADYINGARSGQRRSRVFTAGGRRSVRGERGRGGGCLGRDARRKAASAALSSELGARKGWVTARRELSPCDVRETHK